MIACVSPRWLTAFLDTPRATAPAAVAFWQQVTQSTLSRRRGSAGEFARLLPSNGDPYLRTQEVGDDRAGCHLDIHVDDVRMGLAHAMSFGARVVADAGTYVVMGSPGGFEFCLVPHTREQVRPLPVRWPDGHHSLVDQLCIDVPRDLFDDEMRFWTALTGWPRRSGALPEFEFLERPTSIPLRLMFQRLETAEPSAPIRAHLDLASDDQHADVAEHVRLGATPVRRAEHWVTLRDPAGREYCITARDPHTGRLQ